MSESPSTPLSTTPAEVGPWTRRALLLAFLAPLLAIAARNAVVIGRALTSAGTTTPAPVLALLLSTILIALALGPRMRALLVDVGRVLLARARPLALLVAGLVALLIGSSDLGGPAWVALCAWLGGLFLATVVHTAATRPAALRRAGIVLVLNVALFLAADVYVRYQVLPRRSQNNISIEHDPDLGWHLRPGISVVHDRPTYSSLETVNSLGFRTPERPFERQPGTRRVLVLGDSHTEGYTVNDGETYTELLEQHLREQGPVEVIAMGTGGWSTDQELLCYLHWGRRFSPDLVVLQFCSNDPPFNVLDHYWRGKKPHFQRFGDQLVLRGVPVPNLRNTGLIPRELLKRSALALLAESILRQAAIDREVHAEADLEEGWAVTDLLVRDLASLVRADGAMLVAFNANPRQTAEDDARFRAICERRSVPYLETDGAYVDAFESYWVGSHWNQKGQAAVAAELAPQVQAVLRDRQR
jgi:hypothetical protein